MALELYRRRPELVGTLILADTYAGWRGSLPADEIDARVAALRDELAAPGEFKAVLPGLFASEPAPEVVAEMDRIMAIADGHGIAVVEDNAHGLFGRYRGRFLGTFGRLAALSFHETKNFTCGEGGALLLNDASLVDRAEIIRENKIEAPPQ